MLLFNRTIRLSYRCYLFQIVRCVTLNVLHVMVNQQQTVVAVHTASLLRLMALVLVRKKISTIPVRLYKRLL